MDSTAKDSATQSARVWLLWLTVAVQQMFFVFTYSLRCPLIGISEWVIYVPIVIIWGLYLVVPLMIPKPSQKSALLRAYATTGWLFVFAAVAWNVCYIWYSKKDGTPVSYERMMRSSEKRAPKKQESEIGR